MSTGHFFNIIIGQILRDCDCKENAFISEVVECLILAKLYNYRIVPYCLANVAKYLLSPRHLMLELFAKDYGTV
jgi:hypothetical protein